jgi:(1->4)-alpha-D-glucan 1-alpha-D-glucosylmutase
MRIPVSTYRLQLNPTFGFKRTLQVVAYLHELGISDIYASPIFKAKSGSTHGYDVIEPTQLNAELGSLEDFTALAAEVKKLDMGWLQDIVPSHAAFDSENLMLMDVLENGPASAFFDFFDIDWNHPYETIKGKLLAPFLGSFYAECLENGEIQLKYDREGLSINYYALRFPLKIESYGTVFGPHLADLKNKIGGDHPDYVKLLGILYVLKNLPSEKPSQERYEQILFVKRMLWELYSNHQEIKSFIDDCVANLNGEKGNPESFDPLEDLLAEQFFRLSFWKVATEEINYRRFFNINGLISLRVEDEKVFHHAHALIWKLIGEAKITGLRVDHVDGLYDPTTYLKRLREKAGELYLVVEKILDFEEALPAFWPVHGTTGYDFLNHVNSLFCRRKNQRKFDRIYAKFTGFQTSYEDLVSEKKRLIIGKHTAGDVDNLARLMEAISARDRQGSDITLYGLKRALVEVLALFPVYRTYVSQESFSDTDRALITKVIARAKEINPGLSNELNFIARALLLKFKDHLPEDEKARWIHFIMKFQQLTGPLMAKGFEDTTLYIFNRLLSLNEVGGNPSIFGISAKAFHDFNQKRAGHWPHTMSATATHDTKRGEDMRARINVLSEMPEEWESNLKTWSKINKSKKRIVNGKEVPTRNDEYFLYQTLAGAFPFYENEYAVFIDRIKSYIIKAVREAKVHTAWLKPDSEYEEAFVAFAEAILQPPEQNPFLREFLPFQKKVAYYGIFNSLSQTLIKLTAPGVPDFYQGTELWDLNLVDPDNRRPVDFEKRRDFLSEIKQTEGGDTLKLIAALLATQEDGRIKLFLIRRGLRARRENVEVFQSGDYLPIRVEGKWRNHVAAFARKNEKAWAISVAPRFLAEFVKEGEYPLGERVWADTHLVMPEESPTLWQNAITAQVISDEKGLRMAEVFQHFPVALLLGGKKE